MRNHCYNQKIITKISNFWGFKEISALWNHIWTLKFKSHLNLQGTGRKLDVQKAFRTSSEHVMYNQFTFYTQERITDINPFIPNAPFSLA